MTVKEMIEYLKDFPEDFEVIMSKDSEGNDFSPFCDASEGKYLPDHTWDGEWYVEPDEEDFDSEEEFEEAVSFYENDEELVSAIVLWPIN